MTQYWNIILVDYNDSSCILSSIASLMVEKGKTDRFSSNIGLLTKPVRKCKTEVNVEYTSLFSN